VPLLGDREHDRRGDRPGGHGDEQLSVGEQHALRLLAEVVAMDEHEVAADGEEDERDRHRHRLRVARRERVRRVREQRRRGHDRDEPVDEADRVPLEHPPSRRPGGSYEHELTAPLRESEEEREERSAEQQPPGDLDRDRLRPRGRPDHEEAGDREHVERRDVLDAEAVARLEREEGDDHPGDAKAERRRHEQGRDREARGDARREPGRQRPRRHGPVALHRMEPVLGRVAHVVDEVRGARRKAERREAGEGVDPAAGVAELRGEEDPGEDEQVLQPLPRARRDEERA